MALLWVDGFEKYGSVNAAANPAQIVDWKYKGIQGDDIDVVPGRYSGKAIRIDFLSTYMETPDLGTGNDTLIVGFSMKWRDLDNANWICDFRHPSADGETVGLGQLTFELSGSGNGAEIAVRRGNTTLNTSTTANLQQDTWYYFEAKVKCHNSTGTVNCHIDGVEVLNYSGDTQHRSDTSYSRVLWQLSDAADELTIDDLYVADGSGTSVNDVLGADTRVETLSPTSDASGNWTPNTGVDLYAVIDEDQQDANYISDDTTGNQAVFEMSNLSVNGATGTVEGLMISCDSQQTSRFTKYAKCITQNGAGTIQDTGNHVPGNDNPLCHTVIMENDPDGNTWTATTVNSFRAGVEVS